MNKSRISGRLPSVAVFLEEDLSKPKIQDSLVEFSEISHEYIQLNIHKKAATCHEMRI